jgi:hypothetical protein
MDQSREPQETFMGSAIVILNQTKVTALRHVYWASDPMTASGVMLNELFSKLPVESNGKR